jgi:hypothetical protein
LVAWLPHSLVRHVQVLVDLIGCLHRDLGPAHLVQKPCHDLALQEWQFVVFLAGLACVVLCYFLMMFISS